MKETRLRILSEGDKSQNIKNQAPVIYWMSRDQRVNHNWALIYAQEIAAKDDRPLIVVFNLVKNFISASEKQFDFMKLGLNEVAELLTQKNIAFALLSGEPDETIPHFVSKYGCHLLITDFSPLRLPRKWKNDVVKKLSCPVIEVDARNIIPAFIASQKKEFAAYTLRPKIHKLLKEYLDVFPPVKKQDKLFPLSEQFTPFQVENPYSWIQPGEKAAQKALQYFIRNKLSNYDADRNNPSLDGQSNLSPYLHFGMLSAQEVASAVFESDVPAKAKEPFLEELIVRRELAENFCLYEKDYDSPLGFPDWAKKSHQKHANDKRAYLYSYAELEQAKTHDPIWNAAQKEMVYTGKMHGYMRMYWAKKILEWTKNVDEAMDFAIKLNDTYELDGRDPNGYTGIAWSIGGVHDRAWFERPIFGQIRYMNDNGLKKKFDTAAYIRLVEEKISPRLDFEKK